LASSLRSFASCCKLRCCLLVLPGVHPIECRCAGLMDKCLQSNESHRPSMQEIHEVLTGLISQFDDAAAQHVVAQLLKWSPLAVSRCLKASPSPYVRKLGSPNINAACEVPEPRCTRQGPPHMGCVLPELIPTTQRRMCESILECVQSWNFPLTESASCCPIHAALQAANAVVCRLALEIPCQQDFKPSGSGQCKLCGLLLEDSVDACEKCAIFFARQQL